ncbi:MAG TPA: thiamine phosphate synthase [Pelomicrobium sp.]|nr:thiamine phosphate synthase [Pelomicrobium sp.]
MAAERRRVGGVYAITPELADTALLLAKSEAALRGGAAWLQYRCKLAAPDLRRAQAMALRQLCARFGRPFIVNDDVDLAQAVAADGVHLGAEDGSIVAARGRLGPAAIIGASCYDRLEAAERAVADGADYVAFGSVFPSAVKPSAVRAPLTLFREAAARVPVPLVAIGGITAANAASVISAGADAVAVISAIFDAPDVESATRELAILFDSRRGIGAPRRQTG